MNPSNPRYRFLDDIMIFWKSSNESDNYENLTFCVRNIKKITIHNFIKRIDSFVFARSSIVYISIPDNVEVIEKVLFLIVNDFEESKLQKIEESAFQKNIN